MEYLRVRAINLDVIPDAETFIALVIEKVCVDGEGNIIQVIGNFDRIYKKFSDIPALPVGASAEDGYLDATELYTALAQISYSWVMQKHGGTVIDGKLVVTQ